MALLDVRDLRRAFYGVTALDGVSLSVRRGTINLLHEADWYDERDATLGFAFAAFAVAALW